MKYLAALTLGAVMLSPLSAMAGGMATPVAEPVVMAPTPAPMRTDGDWTGAYGGLSLGYGDVGSTGDVLKGTGAVGGIFGGYRHDFGQWVLGGEADYNAANIDFRNSAGSLDTVGRLKLQVGADLGRTLVYATAGLAYADAKVATVSRSDSGYFGGVGLDYAITDKWLVGGEVLVHRFDNFDKTGLNLDATTVQARVAYRF